MKINRENRCKFFICLLIGLIFMIIYFFWFKKMLESDSRLEVILIGITSTPILIGWCLFCKTLVEISVPNEDEHESEKEDEK